MRTNLFLPCYTQAVQRIVKALAEASVISCNKTTRGGFIKAHIAKIILPLIEPFTIMTIFILILFIIICDVSFPLINIITIEFRLLLI